MAAGGGVVWKRCQKKRTKCVVQLENVYFFHVVSTILHVKLHQKYLYKVLMWLFQHFHYKCNTHKKVPQIFWYYTLFLHWIKCYFKVYFFCLMGYICLIGERGGEHMAKWWFVYERLTNMYGDLHLGFKPFSKSQLLVWEDGWRTSSKNCNARGCSTSTKNRTIGHTVACSFPLSTHIHTFTLFLIHSLEQLLAHYLSFIYTH